MKLADDSGNNNTFRFVGWDGRQWTEPLEGIADGRQVHQVYILFFSKFELLNYRSINC